MQVNREWINISDMMAGLMMVFLFISVLFMDEIQKEKVAIKDIAKDYQNIIQRLNRDLNEEFRKDLKTWNAEILRDNTVRFKSPDVLFDTGSEEIKPEFENILDDFFPRYLSILTNEDYKNKINEVRVEGHTSSLWSGAGTWEEPYLNNMELSQERAKNVLAYTYKLTKPRDKEWLVRVFRANGMSFSKLIKANGKENKLASQRVEFRALTKAEETIYEIINKLD